MSLHGMRGAGAADPVPLLNEEKWSLRRRPDAHSIADRREKRHKHQVLKM